MTLMKCRGVGWVGVMGSDISALIIGQVKDELQVKELICSIGYIIRGRSMKYSKISFVYIIQLQTRRRAI